MKCNYCGGELDAEKQCTVCKQYNVPNIALFDTGDKEETLDEIPVPKAVFYACDVDEVELYSHATGYYLAYWDLGQFLREIEKWHLDDYKDVDSLLDAIRDKYYELKEEYHLPQD